MANSLPVTLNASGNAIVENTAVLTSAEPQIIKWYLDGNAAGGTFCTFQWIDKPPAGLFGEFTVIPGSNWAFMRDLHTGVGTYGGPWQYALYVVPKGAKCAVPPKRRKRPLPGTGTPNITNN